MPRLFVAALAVAFAVGGASAAPLTLRTRGGPADVRRAGTEVWQAVYERGVVDEGDEVRTPAGTTAFVELVDGNVVALLPGARVTVEEARAGAAPEGEGQILFWRPTGAFRLFLHEGEASPILDRLRGRTFELGTPVATAGVRGTAFGAIVAPRDDGLYDAAFVVYRGEVEVSRPGQAPVVVPEGRYWHVEAAAPVAAADVAPASAAAVVGSIGEIAPVEDEEARAGRGRGRRAFGTHYALRHRLAAYRSARLETFRSALRTAFEPLLALRLFSLRTATEPTATLEPTASTLETSIEPVTSPIRQALRERFEAAPPDVRQNLVDEIRSRFIREICRQNPDLDVCRAELSN